MDTDAEILRLRDRVHNLTGELRALTWANKQNEKWKDEIESTLAELTETVGELIKSDEIAEAVAQKINTERTIRFTKVQKLIVGGAGLAAIADFALRLAGKA